MEDLEDLEFILQTVNGGHRGAFGPIQFQIFFIVNVITLKIIWIFG